MTSAQPLGRLRTLWPSRGWSAPEPGMWMEVITLNRQISATLQEKNCFFREDVASFLLKAASTEQKQLDVHCVKGRERIPLPPMYKIKPRREKITCAGLPKAEEQKSLSLGRQNVQSRKTCFVAVAGNTVIHQIKSFLQKHAIFNETSPGNGSAVGRKRNPGQDTSKSPALRQLLLRGSSPSR